MAYRDFHYEKYYEAPDTSQAFAVKMQGLTNLFRNLQQKQDQRKRSVDQFQYDLDKGAYENDTKILGELAKTVTNKAKTELRDSGKLSFETDRMMKDGLTYQQTSKNQLERAKQLRQNIMDRATRDTYYNPEPDLELVTDATHGKNNDIDFTTRGERLTAAEKAVEGINTFRFDKYRSDYVKNQGKQSKSQEFPLKNGSSKTIFDERTFWDDSGKPGVTDRHAIKFIESDERVGQYYDSKVQTELDREIKAMKSSGDSRTEWMKGMSDEDIKTQLMNDPSKNLINNMDYGVRVRSSARRDLEEADRINSKISYTGLQNDLNNSGGKWTNQNILHEDAINSYAQEAKAPDGQMTAITTYGPGGRFTQKSGKAVQIDTTNPVRTNTRNGITTRNNKGSIKLNMTGYQLMPVRAGGAPYVLKSGDPDGMIEQINNLPLDYFDPEGKMKLQPEMKIGINGYTINEAGVLNDIQDQLFNISGEIQKATTSNDKEKLASLQNLEYNLQELKEMVGSGDYDPQDLLLAGNKAGVRKIQNDIIVPADNSDLATIKNVTGGFDLGKKDYWSPEMKAVSEAYNKRAEEAKKQNYGKSSDKKYVVKGKEYPQSAVEKAAKASGMTVDEYIREVNKQ